MNTHRKRLTLLSSLAVLGLGTVPSSAIVVMLSDLVDPNNPEHFQNIENYFSTNFTNVTEIRHGDYANFSAPGSQDALLGTGPFAGNGAADVVVIGRSLSSGGYDAGDADGYNTLSIPVVSLTSYVVRNPGDRMGWHASSTTTGVLIAGNETTVTAAGAPILGLAPGTHDLLVANGGTSADSFNGLGAGTTAFGGGQILATVGPDTLAAYWAIGDAPGDEAAAGVAAFPGPRLLFNMDNDANAGNNGLNDLNNMSPEGLAALRSAIDFATPLTGIPEPSVSLLGLAGIGLLLRRRR